MAIATDASTPAFNAVTSATPTCTAFSPPANSLIVVSFANGSDDVLTTACTDSLASHLTWARVAAGYQDATNAFAVEYYWALVGGSAPGSMTVHSTYPAAKYCDIQPWVFTGASPTQSGNASNSGSAATAHLALAVTTTRTGSMVLCTAYQNVGTTPTPASGQTNIIGGSASFDPAGGHDTGSQMLSSPAGAPGAVTMSTTAPTLTLWSGQVVEILAPAAAGNTGQFFEFF